MSTLTEVLVRRTSMLFSAIGHRSSQRSIAYFVNLLEEALDAHTHRFPLFLQTGELLFQLSNLGGLLFYSMRKTLRVLLNGESEFALALKQFYGAQHTFFQCLKIICGHGYLGRVFCDRRHENLVTQKRDCVLEKV